MKILRKYKRIVTALIFFIVIALYSVGYYVNHYMPKGQMYPTGDIACMYDGRVCKPEYKEDLSGLDIPKWANFFKHNEVIVIMVGLLVLAVFVNQDEK